MFGELFYERPAVIVLNFALIGVWALGGIYLFSTFLWPFSSDGVEEFFDWFGGLTFLVGAIGAVANFRYGSLRGLVWLVFAIAGTLLTQQQ